MTKYLAQAGDFTGSHGDGNVDASTRHHDVGNRKELSAGQAENGAEILDATTSILREARDQGVIAVSSGESEFYAMVRNTATAVCMKSMAEDYGHEVKVAQGDRFAVMMCHTAATRCRESATCGHPVVVAAGSVQQTRRHDSENSQE